jgi:hypothetical protein
LADVQPKDIGLLNFDLGSDWAAGSAVLYGYIAQQGADVPARGNWVSASVCGVAIQMSGPGAQRLPLAFDGSAYKPCPITLTDTYGDSLALSFTPARTTPTDTYTGAVVSVWGLPIGPKFDGDPQTISNLRASDLEYCRQHSSANVSDLCPNVNLSAVWAADALARDVVYMGLDPKDMPRVNVNLPVAHATPPDPDNVTWPPDAHITTAPNGDKVLVSWPAAQVGSKAQLQYLLYVLHGQQWDPVPGCDQATTSCDATLGDAASLYVIAVNSTASPVRQTVQLYGCYPEGSACSHGP